MSLRGGGGGGGMKGTKNKGGLTSFFFSFSI